MRSLDLFSGIGGHALAFRGLFRPLAYCEIDPFARAVLETNMREGKLPRAPVLPDVTLLDPGRDLGGRSPDVITASFPCQDITVAGLKRGLGGDHSKLFWEVVRIVDACSPTVECVLMENSPNIRNKGLELVVDAFEKRGFECVWGDFAASDVGARHARKRWYFLAARRGGGDKVLEAMAMARGARTATRHDFPKLERTVPRLARIETTYCKHLRRYMALGNAVLPPVVSLAAHVLAGALLNGTVGDLFGTWRDPRKKPILAPPGLYAPHEYPPIGMVGVPSEKSPHWPTPLYHDRGYTPCHTSDPSNRNSRNFASRVFYAPEVQRRFGFADVKEARKRLTINPNWLEALMGFPRDWTRVPADVFADASCPRAKHYGRGPRGRDAR